MGDAGYELIMIIMRLLGNIKVRIYHEEYQECHFIQGEREETRYI